MIRALGNTPNAAEVAAEWVHVVYDPPTGNIVHVHQTSVFRGAEGPTEQQAEIRAMELAKQFGHRTEALRVLRVKASDLDLRHPLLVDVERQRLVPGPRAEPRSE
jgi:hypothetical protein